MKTEVYNRSYRLGSLQTQIVAGFGLLSFLFLLLVIVNLLSFRSLRIEYDSALGEVIQSGDLPEETRTYLLETVDHLSALVVRGEAVLTIISLVAIISSVAMAIYFVRNLVGPLQSLNDVAIEVGEANPGVTIGEYNIDELTLLGQSLMKISVLLRDSVGKLEKVIEERTRALVTTFRVSRQLSTLLNREQLATEVVEQVKSAFDYYHVQIFLVDDSSHDLVLVGGTGPAGRAMLETNHRLEHGAGLVGRAVSTAEVVLAPDVNKHPAWLANPMLPDTRSEVAVPISLGENILGVLDVHHDTVDGLDETDAVLLQSIAYQVAIALQNARLYDEAQRSAYQAALVNAVNQRIQQAPTIDEVLQIAARELGQATGALNTTVQISHVPKPLAEHDYLSSKGQISGQEEPDWGIFGSF